MKKKTNVRMRIATVTANAVTWFYGMVRGFLLRRAIRKADKRARREGRTMFVLQDENVYATVLSWREIKACMTLRELPRQSKEWYKRHSAYWVNGWQLK